VNASPQLLRRMKDAPAVVSLLPRRVVTAREHRLSRYGQGRSIGVQTSRISKSSNPQKKSAKIMRNKDCWRKATGIFTGKRRKVQWETDNGT